MNMQSQTSTTQERAELAAVSCPLAGVSGIGFRV